MTPLEKVAAYQGKWVGRRIARVVDVTLGGELIVFFGRLPYEAWRHYRKPMPVKEFTEWCEKWKAKKQGE